MDYMSLISSIMSSMSNAYGARQNSIPGGGGSGGGGGMQPMRQQFSPQTMYGMPASASGNRMGRSSILGNNSNEEEMRRRNMMLSPNYLYSMR